MNNQPFDSNHLDFVKNVLYFLKFIWNVEFEKMSGKVSYVLYIYIYVYIYIYKLNDETNICCVIRLLS